MKIPSHALPKNNTRMMRLLPHLYQNEPVTCYGKSGTITSGAICCACCNGYFNPSGFEMHANDHPHKTPYTSIVVTRTNQSLSEMEKVLGLGRKKRHLPLTTTMEMLWKASKVVKQLERLKKKAHALKKQNDTLIKENAAMQVMKTERDLLKERLSQYE